MPDRGNLSDVGERIERLLEEVRTMASPPAWERVDELIRLILELYGSGIGRIVEIVAETGGGEALMDRFARDELIASLLVLHGLHPEDFAARVGKALVRVRPYLGSHGGDIELLEADAATGVVRLRMAGSCETCPSSTVTVKLAVEGAIKELAPEVSRIEVEGVPPAHHAASNAIGHAPSWIALADAPDVAAGAVAVTEAGGVRILLCRVGQSLYAYRDSCPGCASSVHGGELQGTLLTCPSCGNRYDVRLAGRSADAHDVHLDPVPLLADEAGVRIALAEAVA
jgi:Fe-S cluster biogenesis protein NfuA/nitrite reductase/ring-hydroxylating ferredoxin subunit